MNSSSQTRCTGRSLSCPRSQPISNQPAGMRTRAISELSDSEISGNGCVGCFDSMASDGPQRADNVFDFILLEQADAGDARRASLQARTRIPERDAAQSNDGDFRPASFFQSNQAGGSSRATFSTLPFFEHRSKNREVNSVELGAVNVGCRVARSGHEKALGGTLSVSNLQNPAYLLRRHVIRTQMNPVRSRRQRHVRTRVDQKPSSRRSVVNSYRFSVRSSRFWILSSVSWIFSSLANCLPQYP